MISLAQSALVDKFYKRSLRIARGVSFGYNFPESYLPALESAAALGLVKAAQRFNECEGTEFRNYMDHVVRGAVIDEMRTLCREYGLKRLNAVGGAAQVAERVEPPQGYVRPSARPHARELASKEFTSTSSHGLSEIMDYVAQGAMSLHVSAYVECAAASEGEFSIRPDEHVEMRLRASALSECIDGLPELFRKLIVMRYREDLSFDEIGEKMGGYSRSWVHRRHRQALSTLRHRLTTKSFCGTGIAAEDWEKPTRFPARALPRKRNLRRRRR